MKTSLDRRAFLKNALLGAGAAALLPTILPSGVIARPGRVGPNERINLGFIGVGGMGTGHLRTSLYFDDVRILAVCDVREEHRAEAKAMVDERYGNSESATYNDYRELLARDDIDAVVMATPDHWHTLIGIEAARRGKAMYYEKPMSRTFEEACAMRDAVRRYNSIFQFGTQQRSDERFRLAVELARNGKLGELKRIVIGSAGGESNYVPVEPTDVPRGLDYDMWLGPAPWAPYTTLRCSRNWTLIRDYSLGCIGGAWGIHHVDIAQWALDADDSGPVSVEAEGVIPDAGLYDTIRSWTAEHTYANGVKVIHCDQATARRRFPQFNVPNSMGMLFEGTEGWIYVARGYMNSQPTHLMSTIIRPDEITLPISNDHRRNFIDAVRNGVDPICPVGPAVRSELVCQQADIAIRLGQKLEWDPVAERFVGNEAANRMLSSPMRSPWRL